jgi:hypothetical protein
MTRDWNAMSNAEVREYAKMQEMELDKRSTEIKHPHGILVMQNCRGAAGMMEKFGEWMRMIRDDEHPSVLFFEMRAVPGCDPGDASVEYYSLTAGRKATLQRDPVLEAIEHGRLSIRIEDE